jgi:hypothetical protein
MRRVWRGKMGKKRRACKPSVVCGAEARVSLALHFTADVAKPFSIVSAVIYEVL